MPYTHPIYLVDPNTNYVHNEEIQFGYQAILSIYLQKSLRCSDSILIKKNPISFVHY